MRNLRCIAAVVVLLAGVCTASADAGFQPPPGAKQHSGTVEIVHPIIQELTTCLDRSDQTFTAQGCYERALATHQLNSSWWASLSLVYLRSEQLGRAQHAMQMAIDMWLTNNRDFLREAGEKRNMSEIPYALLLRDVFDDKNGTRRDEAVELGLMLAKKFELEGKVTDAHTIYYEFLLQAGAGQREVIDFHKRTGNLIAMVMTAEGANETSILWRLAESVAPSVEGFVESMMRLGKLSEPVRRMCGIEFSKTDEFVAHEVIEKMSSCVENWGNLSLVMESETETAQKAWTSVMQEMPIHRLAGLGATGIVTEAMEFAKGKFITADRAGRTSLHQAAANGRTATVKALLAGLGEDALINEDKGRVTPKILGCGHPGYKREFEKEVLSKTETGGQCEDSIRNKLEGDDVDFGDDDGTDGDWNPKRKKPKYLHCDFDIRDASALTQSDLMLGYVHSGHPIVLRNSFYETDGPAKEWRMKNFNKTFGHVFLRSEKTPLGDRFGLGEPVVTNVRGFLANLSLKDGTVGNVFAEYQKHPFHTLANEWQPPTYTNRKKNDDIFLFDVDQANALVTISKEGSKGIHKIYSQQTYHAIVYGHHEFTLLPPRFARTTKGNLTDAMKMASFRCELVSGDVLIIPEMWSAGWVSKANGVSMERVVYRKFKQT